MLVDINELFRMLSENSPEEDQKRGIELAGQIKYFSILFQPVEDKTIWVNCAKAICQKSDQELNTYAFEMCEWLQDMNWPGFFEIFERLQKMSADVIECGYVYSIRTAKALEDVNWLDYLSGLITNQELYELLPEEYKVLMKKHYDSFWREEGRDSIS